MSHHWLIVIILSKSIIDPKEKKKKKANQSSYCSANLLWCVQNGVILEGAGCIAHGAVGGGQGTRLILRPKYPASSVDHRLQRCGAELHLPLDWLELTLLKGVRHGFGLKGVLGEGEVVQEPRELRR